MNTASKEIRLVARTSVDVQELIKRAADLSGASISQFIVDAATVKANAIIEKAKDIELSLAEANHIFDALERPPEPNQALSNAAARFKQNGGLYVAGNKNS